MARNSKRRHQPSPTVNLINYYAIIIIAIICLIDLRCHLTSSFAYDIIFFMIALFRFFFVEWMKREKGISSCINWKFAISARRDLIGWRAAPLDADWTALLSFEDQPAEITWHARGPRCGPPLAPDLGKNLQIKRKPNSWKLPNMLIRSQGRWIRPRDCGPRLAPDLGNWSKYANEVSRSFNQGQVGCNWENWQRRLLAAVMQVAAVT